MKPKRIAYFSGTRADFGLMQSLLCALQARQDCELGLIVTGMHLSEKFGQTAEEIVRAGLPIQAQVPVELEPATGATMARNIGHMLVGFTAALERFQPDIALVLGDRGEMLAGALAASHLDIPVVHVHGGERSGTIDESVRHAISKLAHVHMVATEQSKQRLVAMGERSDHVHVVGAPGLIGLDRFVPMDRSALFSDAGLNANQPTALLVFHPVLQSAQAAGDEFEQVLTAVLDQGLQVVLGRPNSDAGNQRINAVIDRYQGCNGVHVRVHMGRPLYLSWMRHADVMVGNSSSGIIEAASMGTRVVNVGNRQNLREQSNNVINCGPLRQEVAQALASALAAGRFHGTNVYQGADTLNKMMGLLLGPMDRQDLLNKFNTY